MNGWFNPDNWLDLVDHILLIVGGLLIAVVPSVFAARNHKSISRVERNVVNGHSTPMREDLDRAITAIDKLGRDVASLRRDLSDEEERRRNHVKDLEDQVARRISELNRRIS